MNVAPTLGTGVSSLALQAAQSSEPTALRAVPDGAGRPGAAALSPGGALASLGRPGAGSVAPTLGTDASWSSTCPLCTADGGALVWRGEQLRVIRADEPGFPAFYRVVWNAHAAEFTDLSAAERAHCMQAVALVEEALRAHLQPDKINLAALGNMVPHLHWHVVARFAWDSHFPAPVWVGALRERDLEREMALAARLPQLHGQLRQRLDGWVDGRTD